MSIGNVEEVFLIKENGIYLAHVGNGVGCSDDLRSSMIIAMDFGVNEAFKGKIKCVVLENGKRVLYHRRTFKDGGIGGSDINFSLITVLDDDNADLKVLGEKIDEFCDFLLKEGIFKYLDVSRNVRCNGTEKIDLLTKKMKEFFMMGVSLAVSR